jgi:hypothetical protein
MSIPPTDVELEGTRNKKSRTNKIAPVSSKIYSATDVEEDGILQLKTNNILGLKKNVKDTSSDYGTSPSKTQNFTLETPPNVQAMSSNDMKGFIV